MCVIKYVGFVVVNILEPTGPSLSLYALLVSSGPLQARPAHGSFSLSLSHPSAGLGFGAILVPSGTRGAPWVPAEPPGGHTSLEKPRHTGGAWGGTHGPLHAIQSQRP